VNVEGNLTPADLFISSRAVEAAKGALAAFETWFREEFCEETVFEDWANKGEAGRRYYALLRFCDSGVFLACAIDLYARNRHADVRGLSGIGALYATLPMPKHFIFGTQSLSADSMRLITELGMDSHGLPAGHWVMIDAAPEFYRLLRRLVLALEDHALL
jgi:hypothetical protein